MAIVDSNYKFVYVDVAWQGRISDGSVFRNTSLSKALENGQLNLPIKQRLELGARQHPSSICVYRRWSFPVDKVLQEAIFTEKCDRWANNF